VVGSVGVYTGSTTVTEVVGPPMFNNTTERGMRKKRDQGYPPPLH